MTWCKLALGSSILYKLEGLEVITLAELVMTVAVAVVHHDP